VNATILDGRPLAAAIREDVKRRVEILKGRGAPPPALRVVLVGDDESSSLYAGRLQKSGAALSVSVDVDRLDGSVSAPVLVGLIEKLNHHDGVDAVVVAMPLPKHLSSAVVSVALDPTKDVDGITIANAGSLYLGRETHVPSTAAAVMEILTRYAIELRGRNVVVVGRSPVVGKPVAMLLLQQHATVTICHTRTVDLAQHTGSADILVAAVGSPRLITGSMIKAGATVVDAGINPVDGGVVGDVNFDEAVEIAGAITPVPGGVGPLTNVLVMRSVLENAEGRVASSP